MRTRFPFSLLALLLLLVCALPTRAQIVVSGPVTPETTLITNWYAGLPPYLDAEKVIPTRLISDKDMAGLVHHFHLPSLAPGAQYVGMYENGSRQISLLTSTTPADLRRFTAHEYGHYVWCELLHKSDRDRYYNVWWSDMVGGRIITSYAGTAVTEGFAEDFSFYMTDPAKLEKVSPAAYAFLQAWTGARAKEKGATP